VNGDGLATGPLAASTDEQRNEFLEALAHDLKAPITVVRASAQFLRRRVKQGAEVSSDELLENLERVERTADRMANMIQEFLDLMRLESGQGLDLNRRETNIVALVSEAMDDLRALVGNRDMVLDAQISSLVGYWDPDRLDRVIRNLLSNALKYSADDSLVMVRISRETADRSDEAVIEVCDQGIGIPAADLPFIFERYHRGTNVDGKRPGTGIGLAGAREVVTIHGGTLAVKSVEGEGSTFTVRLPIDETPR
jgi:signal transduction histidine kinase